MKEWVGERENGSVRDRIQKFALFSSHAISPQGHCNRSQDSRHVVAPKFKQKMAGHRAFSHAVLSSGANVLFLELTSCFVIGNNMVRVFKSILKSISHLSVLCFKLSGGSPQSLTPYSFIFPSSLPSSMSIHVMCFRLHLPRA